MDTSPEERLLDQRVDEMSPHQRAIRPVLTLWTTVTFPLSVALGIAAAALLARAGPGTIDGGTFLLVYFGVAMPCTIGAAVVQRWARRLLARRILRKLDQGARDAVGAGATSAGFLGTGAGSDDAG